MGVWFENLEECMKWMKKNQPEVYRRRLKIRFLERRLITIKRQAESIAFSASRLGLQNVDNSLIHKEYARCRRWITELRNDLIWLVEEEDIYVEYLRKIPIFKSHAISAILIGEIFHPARFKYGSKLCSYAGISPKGVKRISKQLGFVPNLRLKYALLWEAFLPAVRLMRRMMKTNVRRGLIGRFIEHYLKLKEKHKDYNEVRLLRGAWRRVMREFLCALWHDWLRLEGFSEEEIPPPYPEYYLKHHHIIRSLTEFF